MDDVIIEDEELSAESLIDLVQQIKPEARILKVLNSVKESITWLAANPDPDLIISDIQLGDGSSFEIFRNVAVRIPVVFATAYNQHTLEAFKVNSVDYLLKPVIKEDLEQAFQKYEELNMRHLETSLRNLQSLVGKTENQKATRRRFSVKQGQTILTIPTEDIAGFLAEEGVVLLYTFRNKRFLVNQTLDQLEEQLDKQEFFRLNRRFIVNIMAVLAVEQYFQNRLLVKLVPPLNFQQIVSTKRVSSFKAWLDS